MESRSSSPSPGQSGQDDREEDADSPIGEDLDLMENMENDNYAENSNDDEFRILQRDHDARLQRLETDSEAVAQRSAEQDSDEDYEFVNASLARRHRQRASPGAAASSSSSTSAVVSANSAPIGNNVQLQYDRNREEEPGSSSQSTSRVNSAGGNNFFHGAMMLSDDDVDPEIDSAASSNFVRRLQESSSIQNFSNIAEAHDYWQASSSSSSNIISAPAFSLEDEPQRKFGEDEHDSQEGDIARIDYNGRILEAEQRDIPEMEEDNEIRPKDHTSESQSRGNNRPLQYSVVSVPHFSPQPSTSGGPSNSFWNSASSAGPSTAAGPSSSSSNNINSSQRTLTSTNSSGDISNSNNQYSSSSGNNICTTSSSITSGSIDNSQDPTTSSGGIPPLYSLAANSSPSSLASSYPMPHQLALHGGGVLSSSGDVIHGPILTHSNNSFQSPHGEISNPPSPLGGRVNPSDSIDKRNSEDRPESPESGPSGNQNIPAKRGIDNAVDFIDVYEDSSRAKRFRSRSNHESLFDDNGRYQLPDANDAPSLSSPNDEEREEDNDDSDKADEGPMYHREFLTSEAAAAPRPTSPLNRNPFRIGNDIEDDISDDAPSPMPRDRHSPLNFNPHTPADQYLISSSTGLGNDSVPSTPVDLHGDNDLSVPSPYHHHLGADGGRAQSPVVFRGNNRRHVVEDDVDDMIDSTVDSSGIPLAEVANQVTENHTENEANGYGVESSHYEDSSDDENCNMDSSTGTQRAHTVSNQNRSGSGESRALISGNNLRPSINIVSDFYGNQSSRSCGNSNDGSISTSGQVDDGQFRLVPNQSDDLEIEDDSPNEPFESIVRYNDKSKEPISISRDALDDNEDVDTNAEENGRYAYEDNVPARTSSSATDSSANLTRSAPKESPKAGSSNGTGKTTDRRLIKSSSNSNNRHSMSSSLVSNVIVSRQVGERETRGNNAEVSSRAPSLQEGFMQNLNRRDFAISHNNESQNPPEISKVRTTQSLSDISLPQHPLPVLTCDRVIEQRSMQNHHLLVPANESQLECHNSSNSSPGNTSRSKMHNGGTRSLNLNNNSESNSGFPKPSSLNDNNPIKTNDNSMSGHSSTNTGRSGSLLLPSVPNTIDISLAFSGIPQSLSSREDREIYQNHQQAQLPFSKDAAITAASAGQHSSILESMTGPLSKRLRTLHSLQQQQDGDNEDRDKKQTHQAAYRPQVQPLQMEGPTNGNHSVPVNGGHRETNLLFQHLVRHKEKIEDSDGQPTQKPATHSKMTKTSGDVSIETDQGHGGNVNQNAFDRASTSSSNSDENSYPNGENPEGNAQNEGTTGRSNGEHLQRENGRHNQRQNILGGTQQTFSLTSLETVGGAATEALRNYSEENFKYPKIQGKEKLGNKPASSMDPGHEFVSPETADATNKLKNGYSDSGRNVSEILERVMDSGASRRGGSGGHWIDPKNEYGASLSRCRRRKLKSLNQGAKLNSTMHSDLRSESHGRAESHPSNATNSGVIQIQDKPILTRAMASLPSSYLSIRSASKSLSPRTSSNNSFDGHLTCNKGVFAKKMIPKSCRFGPLEGHEVVLTGGTTQTSSQRIILTVIDDNGKITKVDVSEEGTFTERV